MRIPGNAVRRVKMGYQNRLRTPLVSFDEARAADVVGRVQHRNSITVLLRPEHLVDGRLLAIRRGGHDGFNNGLDNIVAPTTTEYASAIELRLTVLGRADVANFRSRKRMILPGIEIVCPNNIVGRQPASAIEGIEGKHLTPSQAAVVQFDGLR